MATTDRSSVFKDGLFENTVWIVTGGGTGIGFEIALQASKLGASIAICGRRKEVLEEAAQKLISETGSNKVIYSPCDTRDSEAVETFVKFVLESFGKIDILVNNAGGQYVTMAEHLVPKGFDAVVRNNLIGSWNFIYHCAKLAFIPQKSGNIINIIAQIKRGFPGMLHTGAARAGVENLTKTLAIEWSKYNIRANAIAPGVIESSGTTKYPPEFMARAKKTTPMKRLGTTSEVAILALFLASKDASSFITGQTYYIDGGQSLGSDIWSLPKL